MIRKPTCHKEKIEATGERSARIQSRDEIG